MALKIAKKEKADLDVVIPAVLFHDIIVYRKDLPQSKTETDESAVVAGEILRGIKEYPQEKVQQVQTCIRECSFSKGIMPATIEGKVVQDADRLESTGAIAIMRTCYGGAMMNRQLYYPPDPFRERTNITTPLPSSLDLFYHRLLRVADSMRSETGKKMAVRRHKFLNAFLKQVRKELKESGVVK